MSAKLNIKDNSQLRQNPFTVPKGYLNEVEEKLIAIAQQEPKVVHIKPKPLLTRWYTIAAAFTVLIASTWFLSQDKIAPQQLNATEIAQLTDKGLITYSELELLEFISSEDLDDLWPETNEEDMNHYFELSNTQFLETEYINNDI